MDALPEEYAGRAVELRYDDALRAVDDKCSPFGHVRYGAQIYVLDRGVEILMLGVRAVEFQLGLEGHAVGQTHVQTFVDAVAGRVDEIVYEFEDEVVITAVFRCGVQLEEVLERLQLYLQEIGVFEKSLGRCK